MRVATKLQLQLGEIDIANIRFDPRSRDDIPQLLRGLQYLYTDKKLRAEIFEILAQLTPEAVNPELGRPGMALWKIFVMGSLRLNLNCDYDRLLELVNNHKSIRQMLGHGFTDDDLTYHLQTLKDNVQLFTPEVLDEINQVVVQAGHQLKKKETLAARCDSFVVETDVHYPTDINLLLDAMRKTITLTADYAGMTGLDGWRQSDYNCRQVKKAHRKAQQMKRSSSRDAVKKENRQARIVQAHRDYVELARKFIHKSQATLAAEVVDMGLSAMAKALEIQVYINHAQRQMDQIERRVIDGETIPHEEKVFSIFQPHTEWISKGKAGVPVELGLKVCIVEDTQGYLLHHQVMERQTDDQVAIDLIIQTQVRYPNLRVCSFDKGFHSPQNQIELAKKLDRVVLPKKGRCNKKEQDRQDSEAFKTSRRKHSAVESGINALEVHGLDRCLDHGINGFKRYVALAIVARNIQKLGADLQKKIQKQEKRRRDREKLAA
jgi:IS5 family transposase